MEYRIERAAAPPPLDGGLLDGAWAAAPGVALASFHAKSGPHRPTVFAKALYDDTGLYVQYQVRDRFIRAVRTGFQEPVCRDACVEFFVQPRGAGPYFNFEMSLAGGLLVYWVIDPVRAPDGFKERVIVRPEDGRQLTLVTSKPGKTDPEIEGPLDWWAGLAAPWTFFAAYAENWTPPKAGDRWRANFYKCADECSRPHWASWMPVGDPLNFHRPEVFGTLCFG